MTFRGTGTGVGNGTLTYPGSSSEVVESTSDGSSQSVRLGAVYSFSTSEVVSRVGVSFISSNQACRNVNSEISNGTTLQSVVSSTQDIWNSKLLGKVTTTEVGQIDFSW